MRRVGISAVVALLAIISAAALTDAAAGAMMFFAEITYPVQRIQHSGALGEDQMGKSIAVSGTTLVVGVHGDDNLGFQSQDGSAFVFENGGGVWRQAQKLTSPNPQNKGQFGVSVDIAGNTMVVGAPAEALDTRGRAYIFERISGIWRHRRTIDGFDVGGLPANARLGFEVATSGDYVAIGAPTTGTVYVFGRNASGEGGWSNGPVAQITRAPGFGGDGIAMSGALLLVSERGANAARLYDGGINFALAKVFSGPPAQAFAFSVAIQGDTVAIGAPGVDTGAISNHGGVYIYDKNRGGSGAWGLTALAKPDEVRTGNPSGRLVGSSVALDGNLLVSGAIGDDALGTDSGSAYVFQRNAGGANAWAQTDKLLAGNTGGTLHYFGDSAAAVGAIALVGAPVFINQSTSNLPGNVYAFDVDGGGGGSGPPAAPSNLVPTPVSTRRIDLTWRDNSSNESSFKLQRKLQGGTWSTVAWPSANQRSYVDTGVGSGTWCYRIRSHNADGYSSYVRSTPTCVDNSGGTGSGAPTAPSNVTATKVSDTRIDLSWTDNANDENAFKLQRSIQGGSWATVAWLSPDATGYSDTGLTSGTWCYRIRAHGSNGYSSYVESNCVGLGRDGGGSSTPHAAPSHFSAVSPTRSRIDLTWQDNSSDEHSFKLQWSPAGTDDWTTIWVYKDMQTYAHTGLADGSYCYRIRAHSTSGHSNYVLSEPQCLRTGSGGSVSTGGPAAPTDFIATAASGRVNLAWTDVATNEVGYKLQWQRPGGSWKTIWIYADRERFTHVVPSSGSYCYRIRSYDAAIEVSNYILSSPLCVSVTN